MTYKSEADLMSGTYNAITFGGSMQSVTMVRGFVQVGTHCAEGMYIEIVVGAWIGNQIDLMTVPDKTHA